MIPGHAERSLHARLLLPLGREGLRPPSCRRRNEDRSPRPAQPFSRPDPGALADPPYGLSGRTLIAVRAHHRPAPGRSPESDRSDPDARDLPSTSASARSHRSPAVTAGTAPIDELEVAARDLEERDAEAYRRRGILERFQRVAVVASLQAESAPTVPDGQPCCAPASRW